MYTQLYELVIEHIYGNPETITSAMDLVANQVATVGTIAIVSIPVVLIVCLIRELIR